jgi:hypothetical protein
MSSVQLIKILLKNDKHKCTVLKKKQKYLPLCSRQLSTLLHLFFKDDVPHCLTHFAVEI